jgi:hypothetical protein
LVYGTLQVKILVYGTLQVKSQVDPVVQTVVVKPDPDACRPDSQRLSQNVVNG